jgi:hypothetical protein
MTKKDYQAIAAAIYRQAPGFLSPRERLDSGNVLVIGNTFQMWQRIQEAITEVLAADNPRFDRERFMEACETGHCRGMRAA